MPVDVTYDLRSSVSNKTALRIFSQTYSLQFHDKKSFVFRLFSATILLYRRDTAIECFFILPNNRRPCTIILNFPNIEISNTNFSFFLDLQGTRFSYKLRLHQSLKQDADKRFKSFLKRYVKIKSTETVREALPDQITAAFTRVCRLVAKSSIRAPIANNRPGLGFSRDYVIFTE